MDNNTTTESAITLYFVHVSAQTIKNITDSRALLKGSFAG